MLQPVRVQVLPQLMALDGPLLPLLLQRLLRVQLHPCWEQGWDLRWGLLRWGLAQG